MLLLKVIRSNQNYVVLMHIQHNGAGGVGCAHNFADRLQGMATSATKLSPFFPPTIHGCRASPFCCIHVIGYVSVLFVSFFINN